MENDQDVISSSPSTSPLLERNEIESDPNKQQQKQQDEEDDDDKIQLSSQIQKNLNISSSPSSSAATAPPSPPTSKQAKLNSNSNTALICDAWYGFPLQKRPRQERLLAVSRQICNFILWNEGFRHNTTTRYMDKSQSQDDALNKREERDQQRQRHLLFKVAKSTLYVIGKVEDVNSIKSRIEQLLVQHRQEGKQSKSSSSIDDSVANAELAANRGANNDKDDDDSYYCQYLPGTTLEQLCEQLVSSKRPKKENMEEEKAPQFHHANFIANTLNRSPKFRNEIVYLSPDASTTLNPKELPPSIVVIGMLVDRKVQPNRSKARAEQIVLKQTTCEEKYHGEVEPSFQNSPSEVIFNCARLPLDSLNVSDLGSDEALNIDTVMEMMQRWHYNCCLSSISQSEPVTQQQPQEDENEGREQVESGNTIRNRDGACARIAKQCFKDAAARALLTHRNRHPKRIIHGSRVVSKSK